MKLFHISINHLYEQWGYTSVNLVIKAETIEEAQEKAKTKFRKTYVDENNVLGNAPWHITNKHIELTFDEDGCSDFLVEFLG